MSYITCLCLALLGIVWAQNNPPAPVVTDNMPGSGYKAIINGGLEKIVGSFYFITTTDQRGVQVSASLSGFNVTDDNTYSKYCATGQICQQSDNHLSLPHSSIPRPSQWRLQQHRRTFRSLSRRCSLSVQSSVSRFMSDWRPQW